jgi:hypothetical protein
VHLFAQEPLDELGRYQRLQDAQRMAEPPQMQQGGLRKGVPQVAQGELEFPKGQVALPRVSVLQVPQA